MAIGRTSFSMIFGGGIDYNFTRSFAVGTKMLVGVVPADVLGTELAGRTSILCISFFFFFFCVLYIYLLYHGHRGILHFFVFGCN